MEIKLLAKGLKVLKLSFDGRTYACRLDPANPLDLSRIGELVGKEAARYRLRPPDRILCITTGLEGAETIIKEAKNFLSELLLCVSHEP